MATKPSPNRRKAEILDVATKLFSVRGFHGTRMDDIADTIKLNKATIYHYYDNKATILFDLFMETLAETVAAVEPPSPGMSAADALRNYNLNMLRLIARTPDRSHVYFQESPFIDEWLDADQVKRARAEEAKFEGILVKIFESGVKDGSFDSTLNPKVASLAYRGMTNFFVRWYDPDGKLSPDSVADIFERLVLNGLRPRSPETSV